MTLDETGMPSLLCTHDYGFKNHCGHRHCICFIDFGSPDFVVLLQQLKLELCFVINMMDYIHIVLRPPELAPLFTASLASVSKLFWQITAFKAAPQLLALPSPIHSSNIAIAAATNAEFTVVQCISV